MNQSPGYRALSQDQEKTEKIKLLEYRLWMGLLESPLRARRLLIFVSENLRFFPVSFFRPRQNAIPDSEWRIMRERYPD